MTQISYEPRSLSQLVHELHNYGDSSIQIKQNTLAGIHEKDQLSLRRFKIKCHQESQIKNNNGKSLTLTSQSALFNNKNNQSQDKGQFFLVGKSQKKYKYHQIINALDQQTIDNVLEWVNYGYNANIVIQSNLNRIQELIQNLSTWLGDCQGIVSSFYQYTQKNLKNLFTNQIYDHSNVKNIEYHNISMSFLQKSVKQSFGSKINVNLNSNLNNQNIKILRLHTVQNESQLRIIILPNEFLNLNAKDQTLQLVRKQISQILNYLKLNPSKRYQQINKLITKRHWITNILNDLLLGQSVNYVINFVNEDQKIPDQNYRLGKFQFYDKLYGIKNLVRKVKSNHQNTQKITIKALKNQLKPNPLKNHSNISNKSHNQSKNNLKSTHHRTQQTNSNHRKQSPVNQHYKSQLQYCRDLQRKTHKYSILNEEDKINDSLNQQSHNKLWTHQKAFDQSNHLFSPTFSNQDQSSTVCPARSTCNLQQQISPKTEFDQNYFNAVNKGSSLQKNLKVNFNNQKESIAILKAQHARQISQYHITIQNLNKKILILTKQKGLQQLFTIHEREIMLLELKIKQLRGDISALCTLQDNNTIKNKKNNDGNNKQLKQMIKKLNQQIKKNQQKTSSFKISQGKIKILQKQLQQWRQKYENGQVARKNLTDQIKALTKRLEINDSLNCPTTNEVQKNTLQVQQLAYRDQQVYRQFTILLHSLNKQGNTKSQNKKTIQYIERKLLSVLQDLSQNRDIILECNNFLIELQSHLEAKLGQTDPQVVLDCNRFIRGFLLGNLSVL